MKYICLGYLEPGKFENMSESERNTMLDECFSYNDALRKNGHLVAEEPLQPANGAVTVGWKNGKVAVTDGPYAETKEQLGGIQVLEAPRSESRNSAHFPMSGSEVEVWNNRDTSSGGYYRNDEGERAATAKRTPRDEGGHEGKNDQYHGRGWPGGWIVGQPKAIQKPAWGRCRTVPAALLVGQTLPFGAIAD